MGICAQLCPSQYKGRLRQYSCNSRPMRLLAGVAYVLATFAACPKAHNVSADMLQYATGEVGSASACEGDMLIRRGELVGLSEFSGLEVSEATSIVNKKKRKQRSPSGRKKKGSGKKKGSIVNKKKRKQRSPSGRKKKGSGKKKGSIANKKKRKQKSPS